MSHLLIRRVNSGDREWIKKLLLQNWGGDCIISSGLVFYPQRMEGFIAEENGERVGLLSFAIISVDIEIVLIEALKRHQGIGTALLGAVKDMAKLGVVRYDRIYLYTTNDNLDALRFYQRRGFRIVNVLSGSMIEVRKQKPGIPMVGDYDIPMLDEIELECKIK